MIISACSRSPRYNKLKKRSLEVFERHGSWLRPPEWAVLAGFYPVRAAYSYLLRLHRFGLLERRTVEGGQLEYRLSERGKGRLVWLCDVQIGR
jgi:hypothetical protein